MSLFNTFSKILITCPGRMAPYLKEEVISLGYPVLNESDTFVATDGSLYDCMSLNLSIRAGHHVLFLIDEFDAKNPEDLYKGFYHIQWDRYFKADSYVSFNSIVNHPMVNDSRFPNLKAKDAMADYFRTKVGSRPDSGSEKNGVVIFFYWIDGHCSVYIDTSGITLSKRNYRKIPYKAPLQETLAASLIIASGWKGESNFINPMCGSGTLAIEAAFIASNKPSGLLRNNFGFMHLNDFNEEEWKEFRRKAKSFSRPGLEIKIIATDINKDAVAAAKQNAKTAGVDHLIDFKVCDFAETEIPGSGGIIIMNPEYGERLGNIKELEATYKRMGDFFKQKCKGYKGYIFTGNFELAKKIGLRSGKRIPFFNGKIDCRLIEFELYEGSKKIKNTGDN
jgi:putative N6-adenine-specific DNA methylase